MGLEISIESKRFDNLKMSQFENESIG